MTTTAETRPRRKPGVPNDGGFILPNTPKVYTSSVTCGADSPRRISGSGGPEHEQTCSEPFLTVRGDLGGARSERSGARFRPGKRAASPHLLGTFWPNPVTRRGFPGRPRTVLVPAGFIGKKRYRTHPPQQPESSLPRNPPAAPGTQIPFRDPLFAFPSSAPAGMPAAPRQYGGSAAGPPRAAFTAVQVPGKAASLPRAQDFRTYSPPPPAVKTDR